MSAAVSTSSVLASAFVPGAQPFVKWTGGKRALLPELFKRIPENFGAYHEPFVGGGALFFALGSALAGKHAFLADTNPDLVAAYRAVRDEPARLIERLESYVRDSGFFYELRAQETEGMGLVERASRFIYLQKCGFNGVWRTNAKGKYNVPFGKNSGAICDAERILACSRALQGVHLYDGDFKAALQHQARPNDFVYFDPPYIPISKTSNFASFTKEKFGEKDQRRLAEVAIGLKRRGVFVLLSNSDSPLARELYADFRVSEVLAPRSVNSKGDKRGKIKELLFSSY